MMGRLFAITFTLLSCLCLKAQVVLPVAVNYNQPLKLTTTRQTQKYEYNAYTSGNDILQVKRYANVTKAEARKILDDRKYILTIMFKDQPAPYPGVLSSTIGCPDSEVPKPKEDTVAIRLEYTLMASVNLIYGNCNKPDNYYYCAYTLFYCAAKNEFYEVKIYTPIAKPVANYKALAASIQCK